MTAAPAWSMVDHACQHCGGRVLQRGEVYRCGTCGVESRGAPNGICGCGILPGLRPRPAAIGRLGPGEAAEWTERFLAYLARDLTQAKRR